MITQNTLVRLDKLSAHNEGPLPTGYWLEGQLAADLQIGRTIQVERTLRAPREGEVGPQAVYGWYVSSPVQEMLQREDGSVVVRTANSYWKITPKSS